jgi:hypothetical protein
MLTRADALRRARWTGQGGDDDEAA